MIDWSKNPLRQINTIKSNEKKIIIIAGHRLEFENYLNQRGLTDSEALYGWCDEVMAGVEAKDVITIGTWYEDDKNYDLLEFAKTRIR